MDPKAVAAELMDAYVSKRTIDTPSTRFPEFTLDDAYAVEAEIARARLLAGHQRAGWKVGYVDEAAWSALGLETLVWAHMYDDTVRYADWNEATLSIASMIAPKIEAAIVFALKQTPASSEAAAVLEAIEWMALGFEIVDCPFAGWTFQPADFVAARGLHAALIVGEPVYIDPRMETLVDDMANFTVRLLRNNELVQEGEAKNALKSPLLCVGELAAAMSRCGGDALQAGDIISTGALTTSMPMTAGDTWIASLNGLSPSALTLRVT